MIDQLETAFRDLDSEWQSLTTPLIVRPPADVLGWEADVTLLASEQDALVHAGRWVVGADDILSIIRRARHEAHHSAMLAWLLDPLGKHGIGTSLLDRLLRHCGVNDAPSLRQARPALEVQRSGTRADIVVSGPGVTLVIENKVDAGEQSRQCDRLYEHFGSDPGVRFLFLTPTGRTPRTATGAARAAWAQLSYSVLADMIEDALHGPTANSSASGLSAAANYLLTIRRELT